MKYRVLVEIDADTPLDAVWSVFGRESRTSVVQVRQEPFDVPSPMWDVVAENFGYELRRLR